MDKVTTVIQIIIHYSLNIYRDKGIFAQCAKGYSFEDRETAVELTCVQGDWVYPGRYKATKSLSCKPICIPSCKNEGTCIAPGKCACKENFSGGLCETRESCIFDQPILANSLTENV